MYLNRTPSYQEHLEKVRSFDPGEDVDKSEQFLAVLRLVDGKRLQERLRQRWLGMKNKNPSLQLATNVGLAPSRAGDLFEILNSLINHSRQRREGFARRTGNQI